MRSDETVATRGGTYMVKREEQGRSGNGKTKRDDQRLGVCSSRYSDKRVMGTFFIMEVWIEWRRSVGEERKNIELKEGTCTCGRESEESHGFRTALIIEVLGHTGSAKERKCGQNRGGVSEKGELTL